MFLFPSYTLSAAGEGVAGQASNQEVRGAVNPEAVAAAQAQSDTLRMLTAKLKDAYNGQEVQWTDATDRGNTPTYIARHLPSCIYLQKS